MRDVDVVIENGTVAWIGSTGTSQATDEVLEAAGVRGSRFVTPTPTSSSPATGSRSSRENGR